MKGMEFRIILAIVIFALLLVLISAAFIPTIFASGNKSTGDINFELYCGVWAGNGFRGSTIELVSGQQIDMNEQCTRAMGKNCITDSDGNGLTECLPKTTTSTPEWEQCKAACRKSTAK